MVESKSHRILAGFVDYYTTSIALGTVVALGVAITRRPVPPGLWLLAIPLVLVAVVVYHTRFSSRTSWLSPGEAISGRMLTPLGKQWINPYRRNRAVLFLFVFAALVVAGNSWDSLGTGQVIGLRVVLARGVILAALIGGLWSLGQGRWWGGAISGLYLLVTGLGVRGHAEAGGMSASLRSTILAVFVGLAVGSVLVSWIYGRFGREEPPGSSDDPTSGSVEIKPLADKGPK
jgi:hypothetical protein